MHKMAIGKRNEFRIWAWLIDEGFDVYPSLVDDKGIDGLVGCNGRYFEVQIKSGMNWANQRGVGTASLSVNPDRIFLIFNYAIEEVRFFTARQILEEVEWSESIGWKIPQIKLNKVLLEKYEMHNWDGFVNYLRGKLS
ncbi:hypothetical protein J2Y86_005899 [Pseudomonas migulae]|uniref:hypothetical protein n=1 Tax=Pseudomonas migulae TaxID=78543 RepID=UPI0020A0CE62|nr:hypothetical protein [Pseudomonas migulae]MCP1501192.1 hypothetical protein [Pseudomonas migulae]